jgi:hypothetical protein
MGISGVISKISSFDCIFLFYDHVIHCIWEAEEKFTMNSTIYTLNQVLFIHFIHQWLYNHFLGPGRCFSFLIFFYTVGTIPWTSSQPDPRPLPTHGTT